MKNYLQGLRFMDVGNILLYTGTILGMEHMKSFVAIGDPIHWAWLQGLLGGILLTYTAYVILALPQVKIILEKLDKQKQP